MTRLPRFDVPGTWVHVMNRGLARRPIFENADDIRYFLALVACAVRRGEIEVHAFCVLTTHFHLLVRSPSGQLSEAMRRIQNEYVRYFNRSRRRDGPLFRGRFISKPVRSERYRRILVRYIDANAVLAGLAGLPWDYPHGSAARFASGRVPKWLARYWVLDAQTAIDASSPRHRYVALWGRTPSQAEQELVLSRLSLSLIHI